MRNNSLEIGREMLCTVDETQYSEPKFVGSFKCGKGHKKTATVWAVYKKITDEEQEEIYRHVLRILGF